jgi:hypothetical protein
LQSSDIVFSNGGRVISDDVTWQSVNVLQSQAWIPARNLWRALPLTTGDTEIPVAGRCGDYQPLWSVSWSGHDFRLSLYPGKHLMSRTNIQDGMKQGTVLVDGASGNASMTLVYSDEICMDPQGTVLGIGRASVIVRDGSSERLFTGCCEPAAEAFIKR